MTTLAYAVVTGSPIDGLNFTGPFHDHDAALEYAETCDENWWIAEIQTPTPQFSSMGTPEQRKPFIDYITEDWINSLSTDPASQGSIIEQGWKGTTNMTLAELRSDALSAGYEEDP